MAVKTESTEYESSFEQYYEWEESEGSVSTGGESVEETGHVRSLHHWMVAT